MTPEESFELIKKTVFIPKSVVSKFTKTFGDSIVMPNTIRGTLKEYGVESNNGYPTIQNNKLYSVWGMRPAREIMSIALGLKRKDLENVKSSIFIKCENGNTVICKDWTVHHVYRCGLKELSACEKSKRFTNLCNIVFMDQDFHKKNNKFLHDKGQGAAWLKWVISKLYPEESKIIGVCNDNPSGSPELDQIQIFFEKNNVLEELSKLRKYEPAGSQNAMHRFRLAQKRLNAL